MKLSEITTEDIAKLIQSTGLRQKEWRELGISVETHTVVMRWLDRIGVSRRIGRSRVMLVSTATAVETIKKNKFTCPKHKRRSSRKRIYLLAHCPEESNFREGAMFSETEIVAMERMDTNPFKDQTCFLGSDSNIYRWEFGELTQHCFANCCRKQCTYKEACRVYQRLSKYNRG